MTADLFDHGNGLARNHEALEKSGDIALGLGHGKGGHWVILLPNGNPAAQSWIDGDNGFNIGAIHTGVTTDVMRRS